MKKCSRRLKILGLTLGMLSIFWLPNAFAAERYPGISTGAMFGAARFSDGDLGIGFSGRVFVEYAPYIHEIALRLSGGYLRFSDTLVIGKEPFTSREDVIFEDLYLTAGVVYRFSRAKLVPFLTGNLGLYRYHKEDVDPSGGILIIGNQYSPYDSVEDKVGNDFGFNLGGGIEYFISRRTSLSLELLLHSIHGEVDSRVYDATVVFRFLPGR